MLLKSTKGEIDVFLCPDPVDLGSPSKTSLSDDNSSSPPSGKQTVGQISKKLVCVMPKLGRVL